MCVANVGSLIDLLPFFTKGIPSGILSYPTIRHPPIFIRRSIPLFRFHSRYSNSRSWTIPFHQLPAAPPHPNRVNWDESYLCPLTYPAWGISQRPSGKQSLLMEKWHFYPMVHWPIRLIPLSWRSAISSASLSTWQVNHHPFALACHFRSLLF